MTRKKSSGRCWPKATRRFREPADAELVLYNTCSIRDKAEQKVFNRLNEFKRAAGKGKVFGVLGCVAQQEGEKIFERAPHVSLVCGSASYTRFGEMLVQLESGARRVTGLSLDTEQTFDTPFTRRDNPHRAYITIIEGCDKSCAYCVVPFTRGPERSRTSESVMAEASRIAAEGYTEVQLLGQNVNSYRDPSPAGWDFATLLARVAEIPGMRRVRYTTSHPRDFVKAIVDAMDENPVLCDHVHLPVQSGSSRVLASMDRLVYARRLHAAHRVAEIGAAQVLAHYGYHRGLPGGDGARLRRDAPTAGRGAVRFAIQLQILAAAQHGGAVDGESHSGRGEAAAAGDRAGEAARDSDSAERGVDRRHPGGNGGRAQPGAGPVDRAHDFQPHAELHARRGGCAGCRANICRCA